SGFTRILIIAENNILADIFRVIGNGKKYGVKIEYITDKNSKGTLDSLKKAKDQLSSAFLIIYGDIIFTTDIKKLWDYHIKNSAAMTITLTSSQNPKEKGAALIEGEKITAFSQKSSIIKSNIVLSPIFACNPEMLEFSGHSIEKDLIPQLICAEKLFGYLTAGTEIHIHEAKNVKAAIDLIEKHTNY
ncbi:MAG: hypothetical protein KAJ54_03235, partial [Candidatus Aenigmarchaeota archaeon]|nr:hypothetical protein [Candidatus Aenigmarchaeota archaeon]